MPHKINIINTDAVVAVSGLLSSAAMAVQHSTQVALEHASMPPITPEECIFGAVGGLIGGLLLLRSMPDGVRYKVTTLLTCVAVGFGFAPAAANWAFHAGILGNGLYENIGAGVFIGAIVVPLHHFASAMLTSIESNPGSLKGALMEALKIVTKKK